jgi:hypothetical protein
MLCSDLALGGEGICHPEIAVLQGLGGTDTSENHEKVSLGVLSRAEFDALFISHTPTAGVTP